MRERLLQELLPQHKVLTQIDFGCSQKSRDVKRERETRMKRMQNGSVIDVADLYPEDRETMPQRLSRTFAGLFCSKLLLLWSCVMVASSSFASAWFKDKIVQNKNADVSVTIMRWGVPDDDLGTKAEDKKDRFVGQVASDKYQAVTLVFASTPNGGKFFRLPVTTGVHVFTEGRESYCTLCPSSRRDGHGTGTNAKGAKTSGGCFFEFFIPRQQNLRKLRLVDVLADGQSVYYFTKFNVSCDLLKSPTRVPVSKTATLHPVECSLEPVEVNVASATEKAKPDAKPDGPTDNHVHVTEPSGKPLNGAKVVFVQPQKKFFVEQTTSDSGNASLTWNSSEPVAVFCAHEGFRAYYKELHNPGEPLAITLLAQPNTGSIICPDGTGYVPGLTGRLNTILDDLNRLYMYAQNISLNGGLEQPVHFKLNVPIRAEDVGGNCFALTVIKIIGKTSLIEFKKTNKGGN